LVKVQGRVGRRNDFRYQIGTTAGGSRQIAPRLEQRCNNRSAAVRRQRIVISAADEIASLGQRQTKQLLQTVLQIGMPVARRRHYDNLTVVQLVKVVIVNVGARQELSRLMLAATATLLRLTTTS
jgi:hypothetical protein